MIERRFPVSAEQEEDEATQWAVLRTIGEQVILWNWPLQEWCHGCSASKQLAKPSAADVIVPTIRCAALLKATFAENSHIVWSSR